MKENTGMNCNMTVCNKCQNSLGAVRRELVGGED